MSGNLPTYEDVLAAARRLEGMSVVTPVMESAWLNEIAGGRVLVKPECLQRTGSFKFRGAWNFISQLDGKANSGGVVAYSSGNHAQGVAAAAAIKELSALIIMPADSPAIKMANTRAYGAEIVTYDRAREDREKVAKRQLASREAVLVPPFEHRLIIAGQGTVGLEVAEWLEKNQINIDQFLSPTGGGGLIGGCGLVMKKRQPQAKIIAVEPDGFDDYGRSLAAGEILSNAETTGSICDALMSPAPGELTFSVNRHQLSSGCSVSDDAVKMAMKFAFERLKLVVEPGGAVALAAVLSGKIKCKGKTTAIVISGGNVDSDLFSEAILRADGC